MVVEWENRSARSGSWPCQRVQNLTSRCKSSRVCQTVPVTSTKKPHILDNQGMKKTLWQYSLTWTPASCSSRLTLLYATLPLGQQRTAVWMSTKPKTLDIRFCNQCWENQWLIARLREKVRLSPWMPDIYQKLMAIPFRLTRSFCFSAWWQWRKKTQKLCKTYSATNSVVTLRLCLRPLASCGKPKRQHYRTTVNGNEMPSIARKLLGEQKNGATCHRWGINSYIDCSGHVVQHSMESVQCM